MYKSGFIREIILLSVLSNLDMKDLNIDSLDLVKYWHQVLFIGRCGMMDLSERDWHKSKRNRGVDPALWE